MYAGQVLSPETPYTLSQDGFIWAGEFNLLYEIMGFFFAFEISMFLVCE